MKSMGAFINVQGRKNMNKLIGINCNKKTVYFKEKI